MVSYCMFNLSELANSISIKIRNNKHKNKIFLNKIMIVLLKK